VTCAAPAYFAAHGEPATPQDLHAHACVAFEGLYAPSAWSFAGPRGEETLSVRPRLGVSTAEAAIDAAVSGAGITRVLSYQVADAVADGRLALTLRAFEPEPLPVSLVYAAQGLLPLKLRAFLDFATPRLRTRLAAAAL
jgi:DNA-binding transcriptional LysR family regulator